MTAGQAGATTATDQPPPQDGPPWAWRFLIKGVVFFLRRLRGWRLSARVVGDLPAPGQPVVVACNHTGYLEPFLVTHAVWEKTGHWLQPLAKAELFEIPVLGTLGRAAGGIEVQRGSTSGRSDAYEAAINRLKEGGAIYVAPEGTITHDGELLPLRHGAARLALQAGASMLVVTSFGGQRAWSPVVGFPDRGAHFDVVIEPLVPEPGEDEADLTGRIAAMMMDRSFELRRDYAQQELDAPWWPPYSEPAEPSRTARENLEQYREQMAEAIEHARERMAEMAAERDIEARMRNARERARAAAEHARHRAEELVELARSGELGEEMRHRAEELAAQARLVAEHAAELRAELRDARDEAPDDETAVDATTDDAGEDEALPRVEPPTDAA